MFWKNKKLNSFNINNNFFGTANLWVTAQKLLNFSITGVDVVKILPETTKIIKNIESSNYISSSSSDTDFLSGAFRINSGYYVKLTWTTINDFEDLHGRTAMLNKDYVEYLGLLWNHQNFEKLLNIKYSIFPVNNDVQSNKLKLLNEKSGNEIYTLYKHKDFMDRFAVITKPLYFMTKNDIYSFIGTDSFIPEKHIALLESDRKDFDCLQNDTSIVKSDISEKEIFQLKNFEMKNNRFSLSVNSSKNAILFVSHLYNKDWKCYNNNNPSKIFRANYLFSCVRLNKGENKIFFVYEPAFLNFGITLLIIYFILLIFILKKSNYSDILIKS